MHSSPTLTLSDWEIPDVTTGGGSHVSFKPDKFGDYDLRPYYNVVFACDKFERDTGPGHHCLGPFVGQICTERTTYNRIRIHVEQWWRTSQLTLSKTEVRPLNYLAGIYGNYSQLTVTLDGARLPPRLPQAYVAIYAEASDEGFDGGHDGGHHDSPRPVGTFYGKSIEFQTIYATPSPVLNRSWTYAAGEFGGEDMIFVAIKETPFAAESLPNVTIEEQRDAIAALKEEIGDEEGDVRILSKPVQVRVKDTDGYLKQLPVDDSVYVRIGGTCEHHGPDAAHADCADTDTDHWGRDDLISTIKAIAENLDTEIGEIQVNDMSLPWGGIFDICGNWNPKKPCVDAAGKTEMGHSRGMGHAHGRAVDISKTIRTPSGKPEAGEDDLYNALGDADLEETTDTTHFQSKMFLDEGNHYHVMK